MQSRMIFNRSARIRSNETATLRRNTRLGIANGVLFSLAEAFSDANLVLSVFVRELGASSVVVGLLPSLKNGGWLLPQLWSAGRLQAMPHTLPVYQRVGLIRFIIWIGLAATVWGAASWSAGWLLVAFLLGYSLYNFTGGAGSVAFQEVVAKTIPVQRRGAFFGTRNLVGGLLGFCVASPLVAWILSSASPWVFPHNFAVLVSVSLVCIGLGIITFSNVIEPATQHPPAAVGGSAMLRTMPRLLRQNTDFRRYVASRMVTRMAGLADPFYILYAREVLHVAPRMIGVYLALRVLAAALSNIWWSRLADRRGTRMLLVRTAMLVVVVPLWALLVSPLGSLLGAWSVGWLFGGVFLLIGLHVDGSMTAGLTYVMELAPADQRPIYIGVSNTLMGVATFFPVLGGVLIGSIGYVPLFGLTALFGIGGLILSQRLPEPRVK